jgi:L-aspartate oxidase
VHGANRLASNSLLEGLVYGLQLADALFEKHHGPSAALQSRLQAATHIRLPHAMKSDRQQQHAQPPSQHNSSAVMSSTDVRKTLRQLMWQHVSLRRDLEGLMEASRAINALRTSLPIPVGTAACPCPPTPTSTFMQTDLSVGTAPRACPPWIETSNMLLVAELIIEAALQRRESRGSHWRSDFPEARPELAGHHFVLQAAQDHANETTSNSSIQHRHVSKDAPAKEIVSHV